MKETLLLSALRQILQLETCPERLRYKMTGQVCVSCPNLLVNQIE